MHWDDPEGWDGEGGGEGGSGWGIHVNPWLIHGNVWQKPLQYCKAIGLQLIKINEKIKNKKSVSCNGAGLIPTKVPYHPSTRWSLGPALELSGCQWSRPRAKTSSGRGRLQGAMPGGRPAFSSLLGPPRGQEGAPPSLGASTLFLSSPPTSRSKGRSSASRTPSGLVAHLRACEVPQLLH